MPTLDFLPTAAKVSSIEPQSGPTVLEAEMLLNRLCMLIEQARFAIGTQPTQAPQLKAVARMLECACRTAFADKDLWNRLVRKPSTSRMGDARGADAWQRDLLKLRAGGVERASLLLDQAADCLVRI